MLLRMKNAGSAGTGSVIEKLLSIRTSVPMVGRSVTLSWTHNKPMWILLMMSRNELDPVFNIGSIILTTVPLLQLFHALNSLTSIHLEFLYTTNVKVTFEFNIFL